MDELHARFQRETLQARLNAARAGLDTARRRVRPWAPVGWEALAGDLRGWTRWRVAGWDEAEAACGLGGCGPAAGRKQDAGPATQRAYDERTGELVGGMRDSGGGSGVPMRDSGTSDRSGTSIPLLAPATRGGCAGALEGSDDLCSRHADGAEVDFDTFERTIEAADDFWKDTGFLPEFQGASDEEATLLRVAWVILIQNEDLVRWTLCWVTGDADKADCFVNALWVHWWKKVQVTVDRSDDCDYSFQAGPPGSALGAWVDVVWELFTGEDLDWGPETGFSWAKVWGGYIDICARNKHWKDMKSIWYRCGGLHRACVAIDLAAVLLHELSHVCRYAYNDSVRDCDESYLIENVFRWAIFNRYAFALASDCCSGSAEDDVFAKKESIWINDDCVTEANGCDTSTIEGWLDDRRNRKDSPSLGDFRPWSNIVGAEDGLRGAAFNLRLHRGLDRISRRPDYEAWIRDMQSFVGRESWTSKEYRWAGTPDHV